MSENAKRTLLLSVAALAVEELFEDEEEIPKKRRRGKTRAWVRRRSEKGCFANLLAELRLEDPSSYRNWLRMDQRCFANLCELVRPAIEKQCTQLQDTVCVEERVAITLRYLATGVTLRDVAYQFRVGERTASYIVTETCNAIISALKYTFQFPTPVGQWKKISKDFNDMWNFPHCLGAVDGKHVILQKPIHAASQYHNYKGTESIVLMALVDANLIFRYVDVGKNGRVSDGGVWSRCGLSQMLEDGSITLPGDEPLEGMDVSLPYVLVGDDAFPLKKYFLKPYGGSQICKEQRIFNYRLSRARRCVESAFGVMAARFRILLKPINLQPEKAKILVLAMCALHNYLRINNIAIYSPTTLINQEDPSTGRVSEGLWRRDSRDSFVNLAPSVSRHSSAEAKRVRDGFCHYFNSDAGAVCWQWQHC